MRNFIIKRTYRWIQTFCLLSRILISYMLLSFCTDIYIDNINFAGIRYQGLLPPLDRLHKVEGSESGIHI